MQISTSQLYATSATMMQKLTAQADTLQTQISTGKKIAVASDDPVAYQRLATLKQAGANDTAYAANIDLAQSQLTQADTTLAAMTTQLQQASELAVQANSGTLNDTDRQAIATSLQSIADSLVSLANTKDSRGQPLFGAATGDTAVTTNADGTTSFTGTGTPAAIPIGDNNSIHSTDSAQKVFGGVATADGGTSDVFNIIANLAATLKSGGDISNASTDLTTATTQVTSARSSLGARAARLDVESDLVTTQATDREATRTALEDTDTTTAITQLQKTMTILSATQASFTKLSSLSLFDYLN